MNRKLVLIMSLTLLVGMLSVAFYSYPVESDYTWTETIYIRADGSIDPSDAPIVTADNVTYLLTGNINSSVDGIVIERSNVILDGGGYGVQGTGTWAGISLSGRSNVTIKNMTIRTFWYGIVLDSYADYNSISGNIITNNEWGITLDFSSSNSISGNNVTANNYTGIGLDSSSNYNDISGNKITNNIVGIVAASSANNNIIWGNEIADNNRGVYISGAGSNMFFHNNFVGNTQQVVCYDSTNLWDDGYPSGGNYWSDYDGTDSHVGPFQNDTRGPDGIGDTPYGIDVNNTDNYPLMGIFQNFDVSYIEPNLAVTTVSNFTISGFEIYQSAEHPEENIIAFNATAQINAWGFCRICIPHAVLEDPKSLKVDGWGGMYCNMYVTDNGTHRWIYFADPYPTYRVTITIPEFPSFLVLTLFMIATLLAVTVYRRKHSKADRT